MACIEPGTKVRVADPTAGTNFKRTGTVVAVYKATVLYPAGKGTGTKYDPNEIIAQVRLDDPSRPATRSSPAGVDPSDTNIRASQLAAIE